MSDYFGDIRLGDSIDIKFTTRQISGAPSTLSGTPVISAYPGNSTTELTAGITLSVDFDSRTGYNNVRVVASGANGYLTATNYDLCITTGTVNSVSVVGESIGSFSIENRSALMPATAGRTAVVDASGLIDANAVKLGPTGSGTAQTARDLGASVLLSSGTGTGQVKLSSGYVAPNWGDVGNPTTTVGLSGTTIGTLTTYTGNTVQTGDSYARLGTPAGASIAADLAEIEGETDGIAAISTATPLTAAQIATGVWQDTTAGDFTAANSIGKSVMNGVALGTGLTINGYTGNTVQTGDAYAALVTTTYAEPSSVPAATATLKDKIGWLCSLARNKLTQTATTQLLRNDADGATIGTSTVSDDGTTFTRGKFT